MGRDRTGLRIERVAHERIPEVVAFLERAHRATDASAELFAGEHGLARWRWLYEDCPLPLPGGIPAWVCADDGEIVGHCGALPVDAVINGRTHRVAWARDLIVDPVARGKGVGSTLMTAVMRTVGHCMILGEYESAYPMYLRLGYVYRGRMPLYMKVLRPAEFVAAISSPKAARRVGRILIPVLQARPRYTGGPGQIERLERFDRRFDELWERIEGALGHVIRRTSQSMNWRYLGEPSHQYRLIAVSRGGRLSGIAVFRTRMSRGVRAGTVAELLADPSESGAMFELLSAAEADLRAEGAVFIRAAVRHRRSSLTLLRSGYLPVPSRIRWVTATTGAPPDKPLIDGRDWYLNGGDSDVDLF